MKIVPFVTLCSGASPFLAHCDYAPCSQSIRLILSFAVRNTPVTWYWEAHWLFFLFCINFLTLINWVAPRHCCSFRLPAEYCPNRPKARQRRRRRRRLMSNAHCAGDSFLAQPNERTDRQRLSGAYHTAGSDITSQRGRASVKFRQRSRQQTRGLNADTLCTNSTLAAYAGRFYQIFTKL